MTTHHTALLDAAKKLALECIADGQTLQPFVITEGGRGSILSVVAEKAAAQLSIAQQAIDDLPADASAWAFAYDGYLTLDQEKTDAIFIEVGDRSGLEISVYAQRYVPAASDGKVKPVGTLSRLTKMKSRLLNQHFAGIKKEANQITTDNSGASPRRV